MNILYVSWWLPYPLRTGSCVTNYNTIKQLAKNHKISLVSFIDSQYELQYVPRMMELCTDVTCVLREEKPLLRLRRVLGLLAPSPRSVLVARSNDMSEAVARKVREKKFDCAITDGTPTLEYLIRAQGFPKILFHHNVDSVVIRREYMKQISMRRRFRRRLTWRKAVAYEQRISRLAEAHAMVSEVDKRELLALLPDAGLTRVIGNGVDVETFRVSTIERDRNALVFSSLLKYDANRDGLRFFYEEILPAVKRGWRDAVLRVTGHFEGLGVDDLRGDPGIVFTGYLDDVKPTIASSWIAIAPIRVGSGTRLKILEAMALGTPVVSTSVGAEGLEVEHERDILIADNASDFARQILRLRDDKDLWQRLSESGKRVIAEKYDWKVLGKKFEDLLSQVCNEFSQRQRK